MENLKERNHVEDAGTDRYSH